MNQASPNSSEAGISDKPIGDLSFEEAMAELETIVGQLESGKAMLEHSIAYYERGVNLKRHCEKKLKEAQSKIELIHVGENGEISAKPMDDNA